MKLPTMFPNVLQAICDLQDSRGSSIRRIADKVQTAFTSSKKTPQPRNVVMQVQRALKHGVRSGVLKHKAGKYKLSFDGPCRDNECWNQRNKRKSGKGESGCKPSKARKCKRPNRRRNLRRKRKPCRSGSKSTTCSGGDDDSASSQSSHSSDEREREVRKPGRPRRRESKMKKIERPTTVKNRSRVSRDVTRKIRRPHKLPRKTSPEPTGITDNDNDNDKDDDNDIEDNDNDTDMTNQEENKKKKNENNDNGNNDNDSIDQQDSLEDNFGHYGRQQANSVPECNNPECLCNLKQEPDDDSSYDNNFDERRPPFS